MERREQTEERFPWNRNPRAHSPAGLGKAGLALVGVLLLVAACGAPSSTPLPRTAREGPVYTDEDYGRRHQRMLGHVLEQPGATRKRLEAREQRTQEINLAYWEEVARRRARYVARQEARVRGNLAHYEQMMEIIRQNQEKRRRKREEQQAAFLERTEGLRREGLSTGGEQP